jgi:hypothetical protein
MARNTVAAISACVKGQEWQLALRVKMERNTVAAINVSAKGWEWQLALRVEMERDTEMGGTPAKVEGHQLHWRVTRH